MEKASDVKITILDPLFITEPLLLIFYCCAIVSLFILAEFGFFSIINFISGSVGVEACDSTASSPMILHRSIPEEVSVKAFKKVLEGPSQREREDEEAKKKKIQVTQTKLSLSKVQGIQLNCFELDNNEIYLTKYGYIFGGKTGDKL